MTTDATATAPTEENGGNAHVIFNEGIIIIFVMLIVYMAFEAFKHKKDLSFGHEASLVTLLGFGISYAFQAAGKEEFAKLMSFSDDLFFYFCLPPIVFASGFNMQRKKFFANIKNIVLFGLVGTLIAFVSFSALTILYKDYLVGEMTQTNGTTGVTSILDLSTLEVILMCSLLCSTDVIAAVSLIKPDKQPKLFSLVFGEGITNDAVSIILFNTVVTYTRKSSEFTASSTIDIALEFGSLGFASIMLGIVTAVLSALMLKKVRALTKTPVVESCMIFCIAYVGYVLAELWHLSGIITLLTCSVMMANYTWYNLSPQGKQSSVVIFKFLGFLAESFVFSYLGLTFFSYKSYEWSYELIIVEMVVILIGRALGTFGLISLLKICNYEKHNPKKITWKELTFIWYAGLIRGAIAFGLVLRIDDSIPNRGVIVTTCLTLVVFTTIFFGSTVGLLGKCMFGDKSEAENTPAIDEIDGDSVGQDTMSDSASSSQSSMVHAPLIHYNDQVASEDSQSNLPGSSAHKDGYERADHNKKAKKNKCSDYLKRFDQLIVRPILIHKYDKDRKARAQEFYEMF